MSNLAHNGFVSIYGTYFTATNVSESAFARADSFSMVSSKEYKASLVNELKTLRPETSPMKSEEFLDWLNKD